MKYKMQFWNDPLKMVHRSTEWNNKEKVKADKVIGVNIDPKTMQETDTTKATIHYSKTGSHIIPRKEE